MNEVRQLGLDLSALPLDDFDMVNPELTIESLTATQAPSHCEGQCCNHCACPCVCCT